MDTQYTIPVAPFLIPDRQMLKKKAKNIILTDVKKLSFFLKEIWLNQICLKL